MLEASELRRLSYLQAMGVESYVSKENLPGALASRRLGIASKPPQVARVEATVDLLPPLPDPGLARQREEPVAQAAAGPTVVASAAAIEPFSIAAIIAGGWLWLEELPQVALAQEQLQLVSAMTRALRLPEQAPAVAQFDWPMHTNAQFDHGPEAARSGLLGFVQRQLTDFEISTVVLLGERCQRRMPEDVAGADRLISTVSTRQMLGEPLLKRQVWQDLKPHAGSR